LLLRDRFCYTTKSSAGSNGGQIPHLNMFFKPSKAIDSRGNFFLKFWKNRKAVSKPRKKAWFFILLISMALISYLEKFKSQFRSDFYEEQNGFCSFSKYNFHFPELDGQNLAETTVFIKKIIKLCITFQFWFEIWLFHSILHILDT
jgi:hypothetical protein